VGVPLGHGFNIIGRDRTLGEPWRGRRPGLVLGGVDEVPTEAVRQIKRVVVVVVIE
jgi:hypothetical protein